MVFASDKVSRGLLVAPGSETPRFISELLLGLFELRLLGRQREGKRLFPLINLSGKAGGPARRTLETMPLLP